MALIVDTSGLRQGSREIPLWDKNSTSQLDNERLLWLYNGLDCCVTREVYDVLQPQMQPGDRLVYDFERACNAPALEMMLTGVLCDLQVRDTLVWELCQKMEKVQLVLNTLAIAVWDKPLNPNSPKQLKEFFYGALRLPEIWISQKGERKLSTNREALEKLGEYFKAQPFVACILALRDYGKKLSVLRTGIDADNRLRTSYNVGATETGRWSSSANAFGTGTNNQNITPALRHLVISDPGRKFCNVDLEQAESRVVGLLAGLRCGDWSYLDACESGDLHTLTAHLLWPKQVPTPKSRDAAEVKFYRDFSYRDMSKRGGHGSNYYGTPWTMARHLKVDASLMKEFQEKYFSAFPGIRKWHQWVARQLQTQGELTTILGRTRRFFGRRFDDTTLREAIAYEPQSTVGDMVNVGLWRLWHQGPQHGVRVLMNGHDSILFDYPEEKEEEIIPWALQLLLVPLDFGPRKFLIPNEAKIGWNWGSYQDDPAKGQVNLGGLRKWKGPDSRTRPAAAKSPGLLDRRFL